MSSCRPKARQDCVGRAGIAYALNDLQQVTNAARETVQTHDDNDIARAQGVEHPIELRTCALGACDLLGEDPAAPGRA
ncbi:hypothetical protein MB84_27350 (plasmid) [Pandoraea oxalativorans]|uniref:Uncharacterized protein n=1 Tax=Pandoraea oxalativorans TaxID=573737 RepID=A0A0G3IDA5_9BURK|nr:hypothetical protein MB84_27350 [Pandoraea oxalativorans]